MNAESWKTNMNETLFVQMLLPFLEGQEPYTICIYLTIWQKINASYDKVEWHILLYIQSP